VNKTVQMSMILMIGRKWLISLTEFFFGSITKLTWGLTEKWKWRTWKWRTIRIAGYENDGPRI